MAYSTQRETSDGTLALIDIGIVYFDRSEIAVLFDGVVQLTGWTWVGTTAKQISFSPVVPAGVEVMLVRSTDLSEPRHVFTLGAKFTTESMDEDIRQILHIAQEARENATIEEVFHNLNMHGYRIVNVGPGVDPTDAANLQQMADHSAEMLVYRDQAAAYAADAQASALAAAASAASINVTNIMHRDQNLSDVADAAAARGNIGAQATLISGTNIKTLNGASLLGAGNIVTGVTDGNKGDIIVSAGGAVWTVAAGVLPNVLTPGSVINTTSGTEHLFTGIPSWVKKVHLLLRNVNPGGGNTIVVRLGAGSVATSGYSGSVVSFQGAAQTVESTSAYFPLTAAGYTSASSFLNGSLEFSKLTGNEWVLRGAIGRESSGITISMQAGSIDLGGVLDRIQLACASGFVAGKINILYE